MLTGRVQVCRCPKCHCSQASVYLVCCPDTVSLIHSRRLDAQLGNPPVQ